MSHRIPNWQTIERVRKYTSKLFQTITFNTTLETDIIDLDSRETMEVQEKKQTIVIKLLH